MPISQILKPLMSVQQPAESSKWGSHPLTRVAVGALAAGFLFMLYRQSPDKGARLAGLRGGCLLRPRAANANGHMRVLSAAVEPPAHSCTLS